MTGPSEGITVTHGFLLGGRVRYTQPRRGFRSGIEPVLLAASVPAHAGERVLEGGTGAGALALCLRARVPGVKIVGVELDAELAALASANAADNGFSDVAAVAGDLKSLPTELPFDHAVANPPYHLADGSRSPLPARDRAKRAEPEDLAAWIGALGRALRWRGTLTLSIPAGLLPRAMAALREAGCGSPTVYPLWPHAGRAAGLCLLRAIKGGRAPCTLLAGMVLHSPEGSFTPEAQAVLRDGAAIDLRC